jgi:hypothetical protein
MAAQNSGGVIGPAPVFDLGFAAAGCAARVADAPAGLPDGFPRLLDEPMAWTGAQFVGHESDYIHSLTETDLHEAENALRQFKGLFPCPCGRS